VAYFKEALLAKILDGRAKKQHGSPSSGQLACCKRFEIRTLYKRRSVNDYAAVMLMTMTMMRLVIVIILFGETTATRWSESRRM
jgi:hypothetical protein